MTTPANAGNFRDLKATLPADEFGAIQWAAKRNRRVLADGRMAGSMPLAEFFRLALLEKVRATVRGEIERGKSVPPDIAAMLDRLRAGAQND